MEWQNSGTDLHWKCGKNPEDWIYPQNGACSAANLKRGVSVSPKEDQGLWFDQRRGCVGNHQTLQNLFWSWSMPLSQVMKTSRPRSLCGSNSAQEGWLNSGNKDVSSNTSLKRVELLVLEQEKILTQFQILSPSPKQKQLKFNWANSADHYAAITQFLLIPEVWKMCQRQPRHIFVISAGLPPFPLKISFC